MRVKLSEACFIVYFSFSVFFCCYLEGQVFLLFDSYAKFLRAEKKLTKGGRTFLLSVDKKEADFGMEKYMKTDTNRSITRYF